MLTKLKTFFNINTHRPALILMYHRINNAGMDPWSLCVTPQNFEEHLSVIKQFANPVSLNSLVSEMKTGKITPKSVVVTFDDGYVDNLIYAKPLLEKYKIPATFFITSGKIGGSSEFWWDQLEQILLQPGKLPDELKLLINNNEYRWVLGSAAVYSEADFKNDYKIKVWKSRKGSRHYLYHSIWEKIQTLNSMERNKIIEDLASWANIKLEVRESHRVVTEAELMEMSKGNLVEIGAHTVSHPPLPSLNKSGQHEEIMDSKKSLEKILNIPLKSFAYPHGEYTEDTIDILETSDFEYACTTNEKPLSLNDSFFELPRIQIDYIDGSALQKIIKKSFNKN